MTKSKGKSLKKKLKWVPMEICRVPLSPDQAVLSCCDQGSGNRGAVLHSQEGSYQCHGAYNGCTSGVLNSWQQSS